MGAQTKKRKKTIGDLSFDTESIIWNYSIARDVNLIYATGWTNNEKLKDIFNVFLLNRSEKRFFFVSRLPSRGVAKFIVSEAPNFS